MTVNDPYSGVNDEKIAKYQAGALEQRVLHMQTADPLRTPTYTLFPKPDYFFSTSGPNVSINSGFAYDHGYYSPNIDVTWAGMVGPGVAANGVDGPQPADGQPAARPEVDEHRARRRARSGPGSRRPTSGRRCCTCSACADDYQSDGHVITQALAPCRARSPATADLARATTRSTRASASSRPTR